jgi:hypothetical protein
MDMDCYRSFRWVVIGLSMFLLSACAGDIDPDRVVEQEPVPQMDFGPQTKVALVTTDSDHSGVLWDQVTAIPNTAVTKVSPADYESGDKSGWALIVFDSYQPKESPKVPSIYFDTVPPNSAVKIVLDPKGVPIEDNGFRMDKIDDKNPLLKDVFPKDVDIAKAIKLKSAPDWQVVASYSGDPIILATKPTNGVPQIILAFKLEETKWSMHHPHDCPTFLTNALQWMQAKP